MTECKDGYYKNSEKKTCLKCDKTCTKCFGPTSGDCKACIPGYILNVFKCDTCHPYC